MARRGSVAEPAYAHRAVLPAVTAVPTPPDPEVLGALLFRCGKHEQDALAEFYQLTSPYLNAMIKRRVGSRGVAEAALVGCYVAVWHQAAEFQDERGRSAWEWTLWIVQRIIAVTDTMQRGER